MASSPKVKASDLKKGDIAAMFTYYQCTGKQGDCTLFKDSKGQEVSISNCIVEHAMVATSQYTKDEKVTTTELARILQGMGHAPFCVTFRKQVDHKDVADALEDKDLNTQAKRRKVVKEAMEGIERVMHARLVRTGENHDLGRYKVIDMEQEAKGQFAIRQVDTRTVSQLIADGVRYYTSDKKK